MRTSKRQRQIIEMLMERTNEVTVAEIAQQIKVSSRTIHRELSEIETVLEAFGIALLKKTGFGIQMNAAPEQLKRMQEVLLKSDVNEYTAEERKVLILCSLLDQEEPIKLFTLSHELQAAIPTISHDMDELEAWIDRYGLELIRRRGYGVEIKGAERDKRKAIAALAEEHLDNSALFGSTGDAAADPVDQRLLAMVGKAQFFRIERALWKLEEKYPTALSETEYTGLLIRLSVAITRFQSGRLAEQGEAGAAEPAEKGPGQRYYEVFANALKLDLPLAERLHAAELLRDWEGRGHTPYGMVLNEELQQMELVKRLVAEVGHALGVDFSQDRSLVTGLLQHFAPALRRIMQGANIRNPLLAQIRKDYETLFLSIREAVDRLSRDLEIPDEEIGFLVLHFGAALERSGQLSRRVRALLVCTSGIGSSKLLAVRIEKELPQIELLAHVSWFEAARIPEKDYDLVISTVDLPLPADQYFKLSPLLSTEEVRKLRQFIQTITMKRTAASGDAGLYGRDALAKLDQVGASSRVIIELIEQFRLHRLSRAVFGTPIALDLVVEAMCEAAAPLIRDGGADIIAKQLLEREQQSSQVIPGSGLALFHTRGDTVERPILALFRFDEPVRWQPGEEQEVGQILLMLGPRNMNKHMLEVLSEVSAMLLETGVIQRLQTEDEASIKRMFAQKFELFLQTQLG